ncbi:MAG: formimidoylglutamase [Flavobacteriaceae bacterium]|nr:formimidoylglutamase [Flavobacteriaceae bacterium]
MDFSYLQPISKELIEFAENQHFQAIGQTIDFGIEALEKHQIAIFGVLEDRGSLRNQGTGKDLDTIRKEFYQLFPGNWNVDLIDLGNIQQGNTIGDTYFSVSELVAYLIKNGTIPIIIGGGQDLTYANYRAYDELEQSVNMVSVDAKFDIGTLEDGISSASYLSKIVTDKPNNLFNFSNIGYQTYLNPQEEIDLLSDLYFDTYRLGEVLEDISIVEPVLRDADMVTFDISAIKGVEAPANKCKNPNGFTGIQACSIARYAGISDKITSFGVYEYSKALDVQSQTAGLIAQMVWYFIEGVNYRTNEYPFDVKGAFQKFLVPIDDEVFQFYKSEKSQRWWMQIEKSDNKTERLALIPCAYKDYLLVSNEHIIPERWINTIKKLS